MSHGHQMLALAVLVWGTLAGVIAVLGRMMAVRTSRKRVHGAHRVYHSR